MLILEDRRSHIGIITDTMPTPSELAREYLRDVPFGRTVVHANNSVRQVLDGVLSQHGLLQEAEVVSRGEGRGTPYVDLLVGAVQVFIQGDRNILSVMISDENGDTVVQARPSHFGWWKFDQPIILPHQMLGPVQVPVVMNELILSE